MKEVLNGISYACGSPCLCGWTSSLPSTTRGLEEHLKRQTRVHTFQVGPSLRTRRNRDAKIRVVGEHDGGQSDKVVASTTDGGATCDVHSKCHAG